MSDIIQDMILEERTEAKAEGIFFTSRMMDTFLIFSGGRFCITMKKQIGEYYEI